MEKKKIHLILWNEVGKSKKNGGLGIKHARSQNQAFLIKLGWKLMKQKDDLWAKVIWVNISAGMT